MRSSWCSKCFYSHSGLLRLDQISNSVIAKNQENIHSRKKFKNYYWFQRDIWPGKTFSKLEFSSNSILKLFIVFEHFLTTIQTCIPFYWRNNWNRTRGLKEKAEGKKGHFQYRFQQLTLTALSFILFFSQFKPVRGYVFFSFSDNAEKELYKK